MEIKIATFQKGTPAQEFLPLITDAHNLRYSQPPSSARKPFCNSFSVIR